MGRYVLTREIAAPMERVFRAFVDPALMVDWMDGRAVLDATGPLDQLGTTFTLVIRGPWRFRMRVTQAEPPSLHELRGTAPLGVEVRMAGRLRPTDEGTHLELETEYTMPFGPLGRWLDGRLIDRPPRTTANRELDRLVELVTAG